MEYQITSRELESLLSRAFRIGFQRSLETVGERPKYISQNKAFKAFTKSRVMNWVNDGLLKSKPNGNGKTSTKQYELAELMKLDASEKIVIRKAYVSINN